MTTTAIIGISWDLVGVPSPTAPVFYLSGGAANADPDASIGGAISTTVLSPTALNNLFDDVSYAEATAGDVEYRCVYIKNTGETTWTTPDMWIVQSPTSEDTTMAIGLDPAGVNGTADTPANESTAPSGVTFSSPITKGTGIALSSLTENDYQAIWIRRTIAAAAAGATADSVVISFED